MSNKISTATLNWKWELNWLLLIACDAWSLSGVGGLRLNGYTESESLHCTETKSCIESLDCHCIITPEYVSILSEYLAQDIKGPGLGRRFESRIWNIFVKLKFWTWSVTKNNDFQKNTLVWDYTTFWERYYVASKKA